MKNYTIIVLVITIFIMVMATVKYPIYPKHKLTGDSSVDKSGDSLLNVSVYTIPLKKELSFSLFSPLPHYAITQLLLLTHVHNQFLAIQSKLFLMLVV